MLTMLIKATGGRLERGNPNLEVARIETDSRKDCSGAVYLAIEGEKHDGHDFIIDAARAGATGCVTAKDIKSALPDNFFVLRVGNTLTAYHDIARAYRRKFKVPIIAITGSCGKTTTKNMLANILAGSRIVKTEKNENNEYGVPLTILRMDGGTEYVVLELGMRGPEEIGQLTDIAEPTRGLITNIEPSHIGRLGSLEAICDAKGELLERLGPDKTAFLNADSEWTDRLGKKTEAKVKTFGIEAGDVRATRIKMNLDGVEFMLETPKGSAGVKIPQPGRGAVYNAAAAAAAGIDLGLGLERVVEGLARRIEESGRMKRIETGDGKLLIDDTYNSSPASLAQALELMGSVEWSGRRVAALGDMKELGGYSRDEHYRIGRDFAAGFADVLITIGEEAAIIAEGAIKAGMDGSRCHSYMDYESLADDAAKLFLPGDLVLLKASRAMGLERLVKLIEEIS